MANQLMMIPGVPAFNGRQGKQCSYVAALEAVLRYHGEEWDYVDLMGLSGAAFRLRWVGATWDDICGGRLHPGASASGCFGGHPETLAEVTGYAYEAFGLMSAGADREIELILAEMDEGRPVLGLNAHNGSQWCVITGYDPEVLGKVKDEDSPPGLLCRSCYDDSDAEYEKAPCFPWEIRAIRRASEPPDRDESRRASVRRAVDLLATPSAEVQGGGGWFWHYGREYALGLAAYDAWVTDLEDEAGIEALQGEHFMTYWQSSAYLYDQLHDARRAAAQYLRRIRSAFDEPGADVLARAADATDELVEMLTNGFHCFPYLEGGYRHPNGWYTAGTEREVFRGQPLPSHAPEWPAGTRRQAAEVLRRARDKEEAILKLLEQATGS